MAAMPAFPTREGLTFISGPDCLYFWAAVFYPQGHSEIEAMADRPSEYEDIQCSPGTSTAGRYMPLTHTCPPLLHGGGVEEGGRMGCEREGTYRYNQVGTEGPRGKGMSSRHGATDCGGCMDGEGS